MTTTTTNTSDRQTTERRGHLAQAGIAAAAIYVLAAAGQYLLHDGSVWLAALCHRLANGAVS